jgi:hypothetical protein
MKDIVFWDVTPCGSCKNRRYVSDELSASIIRMTRIGEPGTTLAVTSNRRTLRRNTSSSETSVLTKATHRNVYEHAILHSHRRENLKCNNAYV